MNTFNVRKTLTFVLTLIFPLVLLVSCGESEPDERTVDIDLSVLSDTMVYAIVYEMMANPGNYIGQTVRLQGPYSPALIGDNIFHFVLVAGVDACCPEGLMFSLGEDAVYPNDYPAQGVSIEFIGVFSEYKDFDFPYYYFKTDELIVLR